MCMYVCVCVSCECVDVGSFQLVKQSLYVSLMPVIIIHCEQNQLLLRCPGFELSRLVVFERVAAICCPQQMIDSGFWP